MKLRALAAATLLLAGCGSSVHPGAAAVIGDTTISMGRLDDTARVYCRLALLSAPQGTPISNADVRRQAVTDLVFGVVARDLATEKGIRPRPTTYELKPDQRKEVAAAFPNDDVDEVVDVIVDSQRTFAIAQLLGEQRVDNPDATPAQVRTEGFALIQSELARRDVRFDPRFGIGRDGLQKAPTGSLSVPAKQSGPSDEKGLPATQRCTG
jgi:hypothetical protein